MRKAGCLCPLDFNLCRSRDLRQLLDVFDWGTMEAHHFLRHATLKNLSEQQVRRTWGESAIPNILLRMFMLAMVGNRYLSLSAVLSLSLAPPITLQPSSLTARAVSITLAATAAYRRRRSSTSSMPAATTPKMSTRTLPRTASAASTAGALHT